MNRFGNIINTQADNAQSRLKKMQALAFVAFILYCAIDLTFRLFKGTHMLTNSDSVYYIGMGCASIAGYALLYPLSSNLSSDFFAVGQIMFEVFLPVAMPIVFYVGSDNVEDYLAIYYLSMLMCVASAYNWSMLLHNNKFTAWERSWISLLPLATILRFTLFWHYVSSIEGRFQIIQIDFTNNVWCLATMILFIAVMPLGFWALSHSQAFSGNKNNFDMPQFSPINRYTLTYGGLIVLAMLLF